MDEAAPSPSREMPAPRAKWGDALDGGFQIVPDVLFKNQKRLGLSAVDVVILLNIAMHWWDAQNKPFPRAVAIAARLGVSTRTVERRIAAMEAMGILHRLPPERQNDGLTIRRFDLDGLSRRLQTLARHDPAFSRRTQKVAA